MANPVLHIKDSYYFEVPKVLCPANFRSLEEFPPVWVSLDPEFQEWEFDRLYHELTLVQELGVPLSLRSKEAYRESWHEWVESDPANHGKPFDVFVEETLEAHVAAWQSWTKTTLAQAEAAKDVHAARLTRNGDFTSFIIGPYAGDVPHPELRSITRWLNEVKAHSRYRIGPDE